MDVRAEASPVEGLVVSSCQRQGKSPWASALRKVDEFTGI